MPLPWMPNAPFRRSCRRIPAAAIARRSGGRPTTRGLPPRRPIGGRPAGAGYRARLERRAEERGFAPPPAEDLIRLDRQRRGKTLSNEEWVSETDPDARIARMKDGTTQLAYKPEHTVELGT